MKKVIINVDSASLITTITFVEASSELINSARITLTTLYDDIIYSDNKVIIPWHELKKLLPQIGFLIKKDGAQLEIDEFSKKLFDEYILDQRNLKSSTKNLQISKEQLNTYLRLSHFERTLTNEQCRDVSKLLELRHGANFSVPGAGKTTSLLAVHWILKSQEIIDKLFVISPINAFISWNDEIDSVFRKNPLSIIRLTTDLIKNAEKMLQINADVYLVNYEKIRREIDSLIPFFLRHKVHLVLDESHRIKSGTNNLSYNQIIKISDIAKRKDILSGTPMPQSFIDLEPQFEFLWSTEKVIPNVDSVSDNNQKVKVISESIQKLFVRTTKNELDLGPLIPLYKYIEMGPVQNELYKLFKSEAARKISGMDKLTFQNFRRIGRSVVKLIQAASNPILLSERNEYTDDILPLPQNEMLWELLTEFHKYEKSVKIEYLISRVKELTEKNSETKILVWSYFIKNIKLLEKILSKYNPVSIYGATPTGSDEEEGTREFIIRKFHEDPSCRVLIANPQACGEGISLHKVCHYAIYLDRNFNAAYYLQSIDRIHRLGLSKEIETKIEILVCKNSIDEILISRINDKINNMSSILDDKFLKLIAYDPLDIPLDQELGIDDIDFDLIRKYVLENEEKI